MLKLKVDKHNYLDSYFDISHDASSHIWLLSDTCALSMLKNALSMLKNVLVYFVKKAHHAKISFNPLTCCDSFSFSLLCMIAHNSLVHLEPIIMTIMSNELKSLKLINF